MAPCLYEKYGFRVLQDASDKLFTTISEIRASLKDQ